MSLRKRRRASAEVNVGPFSDIAFLLIIFFILTATLTLLAGNKLRIPSAEKSKSKSQTEQPTITLAGDRITWGQGTRGLMLDELRAMLLGLELPNRPEGKRIVVINCAPSVPWQRYYEVIMAVNEAGGILGLIVDPGQSGVED